MLAEFSRHQRRGPRVAAGLLCGAAMLAATAFSADAVTEVQRRITELVGLEDEVSLLDDRLSSLTEDPSRSVDDRETEGDKITEERERVLTRQQDIVRELVQIGPSAVPELVKALDHACEPVRYRCVVALGQIGKFDERAISRIS